MVTMIRAVLFDFIGTTVKETDPEIINKCFEKAFIDNNLSVDISLFKKDRGKDKKIIIENILKQQQLPLSIASSIYASFKINIAVSIHNFCENDGAKEIFSYLRNKDIKTGLGTGLDREVFDKIYHYLKWNNLHFDYIGIASEIGRSRPYPDMILDMMNKIGISSGTNGFLKVGDTVADIQEGKNAKVLTAVILSGTQNKNDLLKEKPDFVLTSLVDIKKNY